MEIDLYDEIKEVYTENKDVKELKNWKDQHENSKKKYLEIQKTNYYE